MKAVLLAATASFVFWELVVAGFHVRGRLRLATPRVSPGDPTGRLRRFMKPYRGALGLATVLTLTGTALGLAAPWPLKFAVDNAIGGQPLPAWLGPLDGFSASSLAGMAAVAGVVLVAASGMVGYLTSYLIGAASERIGADLRSAAFGRAQHLSMRFHDRNRTGDLVTRLIADVSRVQDVMVAWFQTLLPEVLTLGGMLAVLLVIDVPMAIAALTVVPILAGLALYVRPRIKRAQREARARAGVVASRATDVLRNVRAVQAFSRHTEEEELFRRDSDAAARSSVTALDISARLAPVADLVLALGAALVLWLGVMRVTSRAMTLGVLLVVLSYLSSLYGPIRSLSRLTSTLAKGSASRERLAELLSDAEVVLEDPDAIEVPDGPVGVSARDVHFAYSPGTEVLRGLSFHVAPGETVCIVGPTGAGKSTLLSLLIRFYDPDRGSIELGDLDVRRVRLRSLRERVAVVPQDPWILDGTIAENIAFGRTGATRQDVLDAGRLALVEEFASRLSQGYDTMVGEGGGLLSGGQRRRIALARALLRNAPVLLLDEPTSGLDAASEATVMEALSRVGRGRTVLMVSHRLRIAATADRIVVLERGRVVESGRPESLLAADGPFARLWKLQHPPARVKGPGPVLEMSGARTGAVPGFPTVEGR